MLVAVVKVVKVEVQMLLLLLPLMIISGETKMQPKTTGATKAESLAVRAKPARVKPQATPPGLLVNSKMPGQTNMRPVTANLTMLAGISRAKARLNQQVKDLSLLIPKTHQRKAGKKGKDNESGRHACHQVEVHVNTGIGRTGTFGQVCAE